ncbi:MAG: hypothetical protein GC162_00170 [Planctomycetes bacterium]|nr:hypothetical protein [Planctomycetota bacterium]
MSEYDPLDAQADCFKPPAIPTEVCCLHCGLEYESYLIEWRIETEPDGSKHGFWCCPTPDCDGKGFGFDILPTDPEYICEDGSMMWCDDDDSDADADEWDDDPDPAAELTEDDFLPETPPTNRLRDEILGDDDIPW